MFSLAYYQEGIYISILFVFFFVFGLIVTGGYSESVNYKRDLNVDEIKELLLLLAFLTLVVVVGCLAKFGTAILPGIRSTGLSKAAQGAQVYFAIVSTFVFLGVSLTIFLQMTQSISVKSSIAFLVFFLVLSMVFYQRGPFIMGGFFGLLQVAIYDKSLIYKNKFQKLLLIIISLLFISQGRGVVSEVTKQLTNTNSTQLFTQSQQHSFACSIANKANQEHDQVWPTVLKYENEKGLNYYLNVVSAFTRPFLSADEREQLNLMTSVDSLNIYNDKETYLNKNYGFSLSAIQYHYFSISLLVIPLGFFIGALLSILERKLEQSNFNLNGYLHMYFFYQMSVLTVSALDERLKWVVVNVLLVFIVVYVLFPIWSSLRNRCFKTL